MSVARIKKKYRRLWPAVTLKRYKTWGQVTICCSWCCPVSEEVQGHRSRVSQQTLLTRWVWFHGYRMPTHQKKNAHRWRWYYVLPEQFFSFTIWTFFNSIKKVKYYINWIPRHVLPHCAEEMKQCLKRRNTQALYSAQCSQGMLVLNWTAAVAPACRNCQDFCI